MCDAMKEEAGDHARYWMAVEMDEGEGLEVEEDGGLRGMGSV